MHVILAKYLLGALFIGYSAAYFLLVLPVLIVVFGVTWFVVAKFQPRQGAARDAVNKTRM